MKRLLPFIALAAVTVLSVFSCQQEPEEIRVSSISLSKSTLELTVGDQASLDATISPDNATNKIIRWSSSKESVATVTPDGIVEAISAGTAFITASSDDSGVNAKCVITVKEKVISVTGIALNKTSLSLTEGEEFTMEATVTPYNATNREVTWTSDNEAVATVSAEGVVKAIKAGTANITVTSKDSGVSAKCVITVKEKVISVTRIFLNKTSLSLTEGEEFTLEATVIPDNATNKEISWTSDNEAVATVSAKGVVKALRAGTANITVTSKDSGVSAKCVITVKEKVISVTRIFLNKTSLSLTEGEEFTLEATVIPDNATNKEISWTSDNEAVATVSAKGVVKALRAGTANITVTSKDSGVSAKCEITVKEKVISVTRIFLNKTSLSLTEGEEFTLEATVTPDNATNKKISWTSDNEAVATVSAEGVVKALKAGTANITAKSEDSGVNAKCEITVKEKVISVTRIFLNKTSLSLTEGEEFTLEATVIPDNATNKDISWTSDNEAVATVSAKGVVKALRAGTANITVTSKDSGVSAKCVITVKEKVISVTRIFLNKTSLSLTEGEEFTLEATVIPDNATNKEISWTSDNEAVATVSAEGIVKAIKAGTANITATSEDSGVSAKCEITVKEKVISVTGIALNKTSLSLTEGEKFTLEATITPANATNKNLSWTSDNEAVATVSAEGVVKALRAGTANITVTSKDSGVSAKCVITVKEKVISVTGIALNKTSLSLTEGEKFTLEATITPANATNKNLSWTSDNEAVATVSAEGVVKALRAGTARITATTVDQGKSASCAITVKEKTVVVTREATHISCRNARLSGNVTLSQNTATNLSFGVLYSTSSGIILGSATQLEAKDYDASFNFSIDTGVLEPETTYYYRSYVILNDEVAYGEIKSFKTLALSSMIQTLDASNVYPKEATLNAKLNLTDCKYGSIEYGFNLTPEGGKAKTLTANNLADKAFSYRDETLSRNTGYSYVAYVKLDGLLYKAEPKTFTTTSIQASVTAAASDVQYRSAIISGRLTVQSEGGFSKSAVLYYSSSESTLTGLKANGTRKTLTLGADGSYTASLSSLSSSTSYNYVVASKVDNVEFVSEVKSFKTLTIQASVTAEASDIQCKSATISGSLIVQSEGSFSKSAVVYYSSSESTLVGLRSNGTRKTLTLGADGSYSATLTSLSSSTSYNYVVVAKVNDVELVTEVKSFKTLTIQASVTAVASKIQCNSATISGTLTVQSEGSFSKSAVLYYSKTANTLDGLKSNGKRKTLTLGADGSYSAVISSLSSSTSYNFVVVAKVDDVEFVSTIGNFTTPAPPEPSLVDLGLSVKWASCNLGASKPSEYGGYYQWAGTTDVSDTGIYLDYSNCPYHTGSNDSSGWTKYNTESSYGTVDNKTVLEAKDDAATVALGGNWRMPTNAEWSELSNTENCSWTWTTIDGVNGYKVQSKKSGYTDNWIFLPAAGYRYGDYLSDVGHFGSYWSSSLGTDYPSIAYGMLFYSRGFGRADYRCYGRSVRPVSE